MNAYKRKKNCAGNIQGKPPGRENSAAAKAAEKAKPENKKGRLRLPKACPSFILNGKS